MYYNPDGELTHDNWTPEDSQLSLILAGIAVAVFIAFEIIGILTVIKWIWS